MSDVTAVFIGVVGARFLLPLLIPRFPLPGVVGCLVLDGVDQTIFQAFGYDPPSYQGYDKAMDVYYLAIAYLATMRNWASLPGYDVSRFLYFYRLVGVVAFELSQVRALLLIFPNTFEYFFIAYETVRARWQPLRISLRRWIICAALIWVFIKLPQEYWIHVAQLDVTDTLQNYDWAWPLLIAVVLLLAATLWFVVRPRLPEPDWELRLPADPLPEAIDAAAEQAAWRAKSGSMLSWVTVEKIALVGLIAIIYAQTLPGVQASNLRVFIGISGLVLMNTAVSLAVARQGRSIESIGLAFAARLLANIGLVVVARRFVDSDSSPWSTLFFIALISLISTLHDRWQPVIDYRRRVSRSGPERTRDRAGRLRSPATGLPSPGDAPHAAEPS